MTQPISTAEAAARLGVSLRWVQRMIQTGQLPATKVGRDWFVQSDDLAKLERKPRGRRWPAKVAPADSDAV